MNHARLLLCLSLLCMTACGPGTEGPSVEPPAHPGTESPQVTPPDGEVPPPNPPPGPPPDPQPQPQPQPQPPPNPPPPPPPPPVLEPQRPFVLPPAQSSVEEYELSMPEATLQQFLKDVYTPEQDALFKADGVTYRVKVRLRGASARHFPKKSWNVSFEDKVRFQGRTSLNLVAEYADATMLAEKLSYDLLEAMRVPAPTAKFIRLKVNGAYQGVFLDIEQVNKSFLKAHDFADDDATIYRCGWKDCEFKTWKVPYQGKWMKKTNETQPDDKLWEMMGIINHTPEPQFVSALEKNLQLEHYLRSMVLDVLMSNNYVEDSESYFIYDRAMAKWSYVPWDLNNVDARWWHQITVKDMETYSGNMIHPLFNFTLTDAWVEKMYNLRKLETGPYPGYLPVFSNLGTRVVMNPELRERLEARLDKAMDELFTSKVMDAYIDKLHALVDPYMRDDPYMSYERFVAGRAYLKRYVKERRAFILKELERLEQQKKPALVFEAFDPREGWVEVGNRTSKAVSLKGMVLTTNLRVSLAQSSHAPTQVANPVGAVLPELTVAPGERVRLDFAALGIQLPQKGELGLFDGVSVVGVKDLLFYGELPSGKRYVRGTKGWEVN
ncbi:CotH kinase family protein [Pyxidicoccus fallax]|uniref:Inner spore coat protein H n=1 Tax=Pyxidicoccus fallax TaxID=394095 RepID=A0A848L8U8_9BACT|nr:CotH kinase family protein [Pyxidicoccus fallax]NMO14977.1 Inner spore coat protein H [Pyxidicoccus fallax]NPC79708.1 CotH kinase family protein [Pyxidicoccus fallax]